MYAAVIYMQDKLLCMSIEVKGTSADMFVSGNVLVVVKGWNIPMWMFGWQLLVCNACRGCSMF